MKTLKLTRLAPMTAALVLALATSLTMTPANVEAQPPGQRGQRGAEGAPPARGPVDAEPVRRGPAEERGPRGPVDAAPVARGPVDFAPAAPGAAGGPAAGLIADVVPFWDRPMVSERMSLTEDQVAKLKASYEKARPAIDTNNTKMREAGQKIAQAIDGAGETDLDAVRKAVNEFTAAQNAAMLAAVDHRATLQSTLSAEQLADLRQMRQRLRAPGMMDNRVAPGQPRTLPDLPDTDARESVPGDRRLEMRERMRQQSEQLTPEEREELRSRMDGERRTRPGTN